MKQGGPSTTTEEGISAFVGVALPAFECSWDRRSTLLYAISVGAGTTDATTELSLTTENSQGVRPQVLPTFGALAAGFGGPIEYRVNDLIGVDVITTGVAAGYDVDVHQPLPAHGSVTIEATVAAVEPKRTGLLVTVESRIDHPLNGAPLVTARSALFYRGDTSESRSPTPPTDSSPPDWQTEFATRPETALLYRLVNDPTPLHSDPTVARAAGFPRPLLHGLCTYGIAGRAVINTVAGGEPDRLHSISARFTKPVFPGGVLKTSLWRTSRGATFTTSDHQGDPVLVGRCVVGAPLQVS